MKDIVYGNEAGLVEALGIKELDAVGLGLYDACGHNAVLVKVAFAGRKLFIGSGAVLLVKGIGGVL